ncbi:mediator of RNA polymerase II transcription subunit 32-like [Typha latifolia]|uniref:mediator of RNA polymerase II transcription subunit 32-like n=1 Tax=Typha latifolia TaxID=4733 RepID=UPI003C2ED690
MEDTIDAMSEAYDAFVESAAAVVAARDAAGGRRSAASEAALERFKYRWELFRVSCDNAEEVIRSTTQRIATEGVADAATGMAAAAGGIAPPLSFLRLQKACHVAQSLVGEIRSGYCAAAAAGEDESGAAPSKDEKVE